MGISDITNASFEFIASIMLARNCYFTYKAKCVKGISILSTAFFASWGYWNIYYYPSLNQTMSFLAGILVAIVNTLWVIQMIYYVKKENKK